MFFFGRELEEAEVGMWSLLWGPICFLKSAKRRLLRRPTPRRRARARAPTIQESPGNWADISDLASRLQLTPSGRFGHLVS